MRRALTLVLALVAAPAAAEVLQSSPASFEVKQVVTVDAPIARTWDTLKSPQLWWNKDYTYSDDPANLYLDTQATGCFCERMPDRGSVEHMRIEYIQPPLMLRMIGALGPLQAEAVNGTLTIALAPEGSNATRVTLTYVVGGYVRAGADTLAPKVDEVLAQQLIGLKTTTESAPPAK